MKRLFSVAFLFLLVVPAWARIGLDAKACDDLYGSAVVSSDYRRVYFKDGFHISAYFFDGKCFRINYCHPDGSVISSSEVSSLLRFHIGERCKKLSKQELKTACSLNELIHSEDDSVVCKMVYSETSFVNGIDPLISIQFFSPSVVSKIEPQNKESASVSPPKAP